MHHINSIVHATHTVETSVCVSSTMKMRFSFSCFPVFSVTFENSVIVCRHDGFFLRIFLPALCEIHLIIILKNDFNISQVHPKFVMLFDKSMNHNDSYIILFYIDGVDFSLKHRFFQVFS